MHVQCYNDSRDAHVNDAQLALTMPSTVDAASLEMTDWSYGMTQGDLPDVTMKKKETGSISILVPCLIF